MCKQDFVHRFQQTWTELRMNTVDRVYDLPGYFVFGQIDSKLFFAIFAPLRETVLG